ncbi:MAG: AMP-binding protein, partial [Mesorhizobium sp.]
MANTLYDALFLAHEGSEKTFLALKAGRAVSYGAFLRQTARFAHALRACGVEPGDRVALQAKKSPEALAVYAACVAAGAVFLPLNTAYTPSEVDYFVSDGQAKLLVCDGAGASALEPVAAGAGARLLTLNGDGSGTLA